MIYKEYDYTVLLSRLQHLALVAPKKIEKIIHAFITILKTITQNYLREIHVIHIFNYMLIIYILPCCQQVEMPVCDPN